MLDSGERAYAYSKACGIIGKSFVGRRVAALANLRSLNELDRLVFPNTHRELPQRELLADLEKRIVRRAVKHILSVIESFRNPPALLVRQLRAYEYADLKTCLHYVQAGKKSPPRLAAIGNYGTVKFQFFPDIRAMLEKTEFDFLLKENPSRFEDGNFDLTAVETEMDRRYYAALKDDLFRLSGEDRAIAWRLLAEEISLRNCIWALRLRSYFEKTPDEAAKYLLNITMPVYADDNARFHKSRAPVQNGGVISLAAEALQSLDMPMDLRGAWDGWRWEAFLNPETTGEIWKASPRYFQNASSQYLYSLALKALHDMPSSVSAIFCFIKLKQFEEDILTSVAEGFGLGLPCSEVFDLLEVAV